MSTTDPTAARGYQPVPLFFEEYVTDLQPVGRHCCDACLRDDLDCWAGDRLNGANYCEACLRRDHASDLGEQQAIFTIIDGAVTAAVHAAAGAHSIPNRRDVELVRAAVGEALARVEQTAAAAEAEMLERYAGRS